MELDHIRVQDVMHRGILSCSADAPLGEVAGVMPTHRVQAVAVTDAPGGRPIGEASDLDLVGAAASGEEPTAGQAPPPSRWPSRPTSGFTARHS